MTQLISWSQLCFHITPLLTALACSLGYFILLVSSHMISVQHSKAHHHYESSNLLQLSFRYAAAISNLHLLLISLPSCSPAL